MEAGAGDADILWAFNMTDECGVSPHNVTSSSVIVVGDKVWCSTSNGVDYGHIDMPNPNTRNVHRHRSGRARTDNYCRYHIHPPPAPEL